MVFVGIVDFLQRILGCFFDTIFKHDLEDLHHFLRNIPLKNVALAIEEFFADLHFLLFFSSDDIRQKMIQVINGIVLS